MIITIPIGSLKNAREGQLMPEKFHCVFRDTYKIFVIKGKPKPLGVSWIVLMQVELWPETDAYILTKTQ